MNQSQAFEKEIVENNANVSQLVRHKVPSHMDTFSVTVSYPDSTDKKTFDDIGQILVYRMLQQTGQLETFASALFNNDLEVFLKNGYTVREYHPEDEGKEGPKTFTVSIVHGNVTHILEGVPEFKLSTALNMEPAKLSMKNVYRLNFQDALDQGYAVQQYKLHEGNQNYSVQLLKEDKVKTFTNISAAHLAAAMNTGVKDLLSEFGEHISAEKLARSTSYSPRTSSRKMSLEDAVALGAQMTSATAHAKDPNIYAIKVKSGDIEHVFPNVSKAHCQKIPGFDKFAELREA